MVAEKICKRNAGRMHPDVKNVGNLQVIKGMVSLRNSKCFPGRFHDTRVKKLLFLMKQNFWTFLVESSRPTVGDLFENKYSYRLGGRPSNRTILPNSRPTGQSENLD